MFYNWEALQVKTLHIVSWDLRARKGVNAVHRCSIENQKGIIAVQKKKMAMAVAPFWFSMEHRWTMLMPFSGVPTNVAPTREGWAHQWMRPNLPLIWAGDTPPPPPPPDMTVEAICKIIFYGDRMSLQVSAATFRSTFGSSVQGLNWRGKIQSGHFGGSTPPPPKLLSP